MGIYIYSMRKKKLPIWIDNEKVMANNFDYAYKESWGYWAESDKGYQFLVRNTDRLADAAFEAYDGGYVLVGGHGEGIGVYRAVTSGIWYDTGDFPGEYVGHLTKDGHRYTLVPQPINKENVA